jgi:hypothetical protein
MKRKRNVFARAADALFGKKTRQRASAGHHRTLGFEQLENRVLLAAATQGIGITGHVSIDSVSAGTAVRNALVVVTAPVINVNTGKATTTTMSDFTDNSGLYVVGDLGPYVLDTSPAAEISVVVYAKSPSIRANDPNDVDPAYAVGCDTGGFSWRPYEEDFEVRMGSAIIDAHDACAGAVIRVQPYGNVSVPYGAPILAYQGFEAFTVVGVYAGWATNRLGVVPTDRLTIDLAATSYNWYDWKYNEIHLHIPLFGTLSDWKAVGHEYAHYIAHEAGFGNSPGGEHAFLNSQRLMPNPSPETALMGDDLVSVKASPRREMGGESTQYYYGANALAC